MVSSHLLAEIQAACDRLVATSPGSCRRQASGRFSTANALLRFRDTARTGAITMSTLAGLVTMFAFTGAEPTQGGSRPAPGGAADASSLLAEADGVLGGLILASGMVGIIALALSALSVARDFELGTIRVLLVNQPDRLRFLAGKLAALTAVIIVSVTAAAVAGIFGLAPSSSAEIDTSSRSASATLATYANLGIAALLAGYAAVATATLSTVFARRDITD